MMHCLILSSYCFWSQYLLTGVVAIFLLVRFGGLGVFCPLQTAGLFYNASRASTKILSYVLHGDSSFELATHESMQLSVQYVVIMLLGWKIISAAI